MLAPWVTASNVPGPFHLTLLGERVMSHDEVNHVWPSYDFFKGKGYAHNPVTHGPFQFHVVALSYFLFGDNDFPSRIPAASSTTNCNDWMICSPECCARRGR